MPLNECQLLLYSCTCTRRNSYRIMLLRINAMCPRTYRYMHSVHVHVVHVNAWLLHVLVRWTQRTHIDLHLYRRAIAGAIARGLSLHKRSRLHFVRGSRGEAARVAEEAKNHFETGRCSDSDGFSARHSSREYAYYEQFRGFRRSGPEQHYE